VEIWRSSDKNNLGHFWHTLYIVYTLENIMIKLDKKTIADGLKFPKSSACDRQVVGSTPGPIAVRW